MKTLLLVAIALLVLATIAAGALKRRKQAGGVSTRARQVMTKREQGMYWRLRETFPDAVVLAQVSFSALITSERAHRNRYDRKTADFVLCDPSMQVRAVIELDDASHKGREANDAARDALLRQAGYTTLRFANVPDAAELRERVPTQPDTPSKPRKATLIPPMAK